MPLDRGFVVREYSNVRTNERTDCTPECCDVPCFKQDLVARLRREIPDDEQLEDARVIFGALADRTRLKILHALSGGEELCVCDVAHVLGMSVASASHHLRKLRDLRILKYRTDGKMAYYSIRSRLVPVLIGRVLKAAA
jgi:ArsR family transcriptional regulator, lead/cadmium/zinc/bismuth-responsive transcriptional repressor